MSAIVGILAYLMGIGIVAGGVRWLYWIFQEQNKQPDTAPASIPVTPATAPAPLREIPVAKPVAPPSGSSLATGSRTSVTAAISADPPILCLSFGQLAQYASHADSQMRVAAAESLTQMVLRDQGRGVERIVPLLGTLSQDSVQAVRLQAIAGLGQIRSPRVLPWLSRALKSPDSQVNKAASQGLQQLKLQYKGETEKVARVVRNATPR